MQYKPTDKIQLAARGEYYSDEKGVIIVTETPNGFKTYGFSANFDYLVADNVMFRIEARNLSSKDEIFTKDKLLLQWDNTTKRYTLVINTDIL